MLNLNQTVKMKKTVFVGKDEKMVIRVGLYICKHGTKFYFFIDKKNTIIIDFFDCNKYNSQK
jgi:hypothetical protein